ncbi:P-loop containing nucleoside triphosphate hydrolase protein [Helicostylum pulchrum]|nr:P-loop containing nucleoside triphosphate hydrolase protein [Helicostylum pulchrum]
MSKEYRMDDGQKQQVYTDNCQQVLTDISTVKQLVHQLKEVDDIYYPTTSSFNILAVQDIETLSDSIPQLLVQKLIGCIGHLNNLTARVSDTSSKVLVTGDLNSGKSTLVNALLKQDILPVDQQPCTSMFCEVVSSNDQEPTTVHAIGDVSSYDKNNGDTYNPLELRHLYKVLTADEQDLAYKMLKIYVSRDQDLIKEDSLLYNGVVDIALIDSPGLNTDSVKTTAVFAREEEIDVVVFVVSAENHFTLSGKEFLWNAANEKTHIFIVVNRFDNIRDKERCKRLILDQIKQLSPSTYEQQDNLIHFISAANQIDSTDFIKMEQKLRSFVLNNRIQSKLLPVQNYLSNLLRDIYFISTINQSKASELLDLDTHNFESDFLPGYSNFINVQASVENQIGQLKDTTLQSIKYNVHHALQLAASHDQLQKSICSIQYPGLLLTWQYAQDIVDSLSRQLEETLCKVESEANTDAVDCMNKMNQLTLDQLKIDITTKVHQQVVIGRAHKPIHINVDARDLLLNRKIVDDKKLVVSGLATISTVTIFFKSINLKDLAWSVFSTYISADTTTATDTPGRLVIFTLTTVGLLGLGYTAYSFISVIPQALETNLKQKFQQAIETEKFTCNQTNRITQAVEQALDAKQTEIVYRIKQLKSQKETEKSNLENSIFYSKSRLNHFQKLVLQSNDLLVKVEESLVVMSSPLI